MRIPKQAFCLAVCAVLSLSGQRAAAQAAQSVKPGSCAPAGERRNVILFVADGMRHDSVQPDIAPTMFLLRQKGVEFANSHSLYPTFTTPNASAFATGHLIGDTGDFGNTLYVGHAMHTGNPVTATVTPFIEDDALLSMINFLWGGRFIPQQTLMELARENGYLVATVGKSGPVAIQDIGEIKQSQVGGKLRSTQAILMDDNNPFLASDMSIPFLQAASGAGLSLFAPDRSNNQAGTLQDNGNSGDYLVSKTRRGTIASNYFQQQYFSNAVTQAILPMFLKFPQPFFLVYWSRDPDGSQHNQGDSQDKSGGTQFYPGIDGSTSRAGVHNADSNLWQIVDFLRNSDRNLLEQTDIIVVADHGFSTISRKKLSITGAATKSYSATLNYAGVGVVAGQQGTLPPGFLAIDLAHALNKSLYDPDAPLVLAKDGIHHYYQPVVSSTGSAFSTHPLHGNGIIGGSGQVPEDDENLEPAMTDADIIVAANGGSDLIYLPQKNVDANKKLTQAIADFLLRQDYVDGVFVNDDFGAVPGTLRFSDIGLKGESKLPRPAIIVNFKSFQIGGTPLVRAEISDTTLRQGQGMHGSFSRADTFNNMFAFGPDFRTGYVDHAPANNADVAATLACIMGFELPPTGGSLRGRVLSESLKGSPEPPQTRPEPLFARQPGPGGARTVLVYQEFAGRRYYDQACLTRQTDAKDPCQ